MKNTLFIVAAVFAFSGCAGLTQMQDTVTKFDQGAHSVSTAQMSFSIKCKQPNATEISMKKHSAFHRVNRFHLISWSPAPIRN